ncbi:peptide ABC transporter ATP-binding protein, partial [Candidatus Magnetomorum sp. HK-1]
DKDTSWKLQINEGLKIKKGFIAILGESGSGKSTLISILSGFEKLSSEQKSQITCCVSDRKIKYSEKDLKKIIKNNFGYIFQRCYEAKSLTAQDNIALPLIVKKYSFEKAYNYCSKLLSSLRMEKFSNSPANELSVLKRSSLRCAYLSVIRELV